MSRVPRDYQTLRDDHSRALEALDQHIEKPAAPEQAPAEPSAELQTQPEADPQPTRPENTHPQSRGWTDMGNMPAQHASATNYHTLIIADLESRGQDQDRDSGGVESPTQGADVNRDDAQDGVRAWLTNDDGTVTDISKEINGDRGADSHDATSDRLQEHIERAESGDLQSRFQETARETLDRHEPPEIKPPPGPELEV